MLTPAQNDANGCIVVAIHFDGSICVLDVRKKQHLWTMKVHEEIADTCAVAGARITTSSSDGTFAVSNWKTGQIEWKKKIGQPRRAVNGKVVGGYALAQEVWEEKVAAGTKDGRLLILDLKTG